MSTEPEHVLLERRGAVAILTLNRPERLNAFAAPTNRAIVAHLDTIRRDETIRAVVLTGAGRGFCAGADLAAARNRGPEHDTAQSLRELYHPLILAMRHLPKPIVTAVNGPAAGAGMSIALAGDIVLAAESASFMQAFSRIGLIPDCGSTWMLPRMVGDVRARAMAILAEKIPARDALQFGMVWQVHADDALMPQARQLAARLATMPTRAYALIKEAFACTYANGFAEQLEVEARLQSIAGTTEDNREGVQAFLEKRAPRFTGR